MCTNSYMELRWLPRCWRLPSSPQFPRILLRIGRSRVGTLKGWHVLGQADWRAEKGELIGTPKSASGGWLVLDNSYQDIQFFLLHSVAPAVARPACCSVLKRPRAA